MTPSTTVGEIRFLRVTVMRGMCHTKKEKKHTTDLPGHEQSAWPQVIPCYCALKLVSSEFWAFVIAVPYLCLLFNFLPQNNPSLGSCLLTPHPALNPQCRDRLFYCSWLCMVVGYVMSCHLLWWDYNGLAECFILIGPRVSIHFKLKLKRHVGPC